MARQPQLYCPGAFYYLLNRGNRRQPIFHDEPDYQTLMAAWAAATVRYQLTIHAYWLTAYHFCLDVLDIINPGGFLCCPAPNMRKESRMPRSLRGGEPLWS